MKSFIGLLRGINVGGNNKIPMADLRALCGKLGWENVQTYIQSGNIVFSASGKATALEAELERAIVKRFGLSIPVVVRAAADWPAYIQSNPFLDACEKEPHLVMLCLSKNRPKSDAAKALLERAGAGEHIEQIDDALWIHFPNGVARSKLSPALLDRMTGSSVTARNWLTVLKLQEMASQLSAKNRRDSCHAKMENVKSIFVVVACMAMSVIVIWIADDLVAPLFLNSRIERLGEKNLPKVTIEKGIVHCRMKADDFSFALPPGSHARIRLPRADLILLTGCGSDI